MLKDRLSTYVRIWRQCLEADYSSNDARAYAQLEIERLDKLSDEPAPLILLPATTEVQGPPAPIRQHIPPIPSIPNTTRIIDKVKPPSFPTPAFIKPNSRTVDKIRAYAAHSPMDDADMLSDEEWQRRYGQYY